ncbi:hypothetical protein [uncultured Croceitalea sp.]|uniref:hypothetical protein n=1 Tax=uncultured Croceitalea sp. TaxID=1798908 RepID=UPI003306232E
MRKLIIVLAAIVSGCSSTSLVTNWKNPDIVIFDANKVLIVGMTANEEARVKFENRLQAEFEKRNVDSFKSIDLFDVEFTSSEKSEEELSEVEQQLLDKDFDAILFTKIIGSENRQNFKRRMSDMDRLFDTFNDDYLEYQPIYYEDEYYDQFTIYHAETSLYCICVGKERQLIWRGNIHIMDPVNIDKTVDDYIKLVVFALKEQELIFRKEHANETTSI